MSKTQDTKQTLREPCAQCPFRRTSLRGYVGGHSNVSEITNLVWNDRKFPCHMDVTRILEKQHIADTGEELPIAVVDEAQHCAGALALLNNAYKRSRDKSVSAAQKLIGKRADVFNRPEEMQAYHGTALDEEDD